MRIIFFALSILFVGKFSFGQTGIQLPIASIKTSTTTGEKPQSKIWKYEDEFYSVFPNDSGTHVWKLVKNKWIQHKLLTTNKNSKADCYVVSDTVFILLFQVPKSEFTVLKFNESGQKYQFLNPRDTISQITFDSSTETATIAFDSESTLWMTYEANNNIEVRNSTPPYTSWSNSEHIYTGVADDDISAIVTMSNSVGVLWSNQATERFGFKSHKDGDSISIWSRDEVPASQSALNIGKGMADDHLNLKHTSDGELFAAVKTSYDTPSYTKIGLLVRRSNGTWDDLHHVSYFGTRPIVAIDNGNRFVKVFYTSTESGGDIMLKESKTDSVEFGKGIIFLEGNSFNNPSSTKFPYDGTNIVIAAGDNIIVGKAID